MSDLRVCALVLAFVANAGASLADDVGGNAWPSFVGRHSVKVAFDLQADIDKSDRTVAECIDVHAVMSCGFAIDPADGEMPDEVLEVAGLDSDLISNIELDGSGSTPERRSHYLGQFQTLIRILSPGIAWQEIDRLADGLQLGATPQKDLRTVAHRPFATITCAQGGAASAYIQCQAERP